MKTLSFAIALALASTCAQAEKFPPSYVKQMPPEQQKKELALLQHERRLLIDTCEKAWRLYGGLYALDNPYIDSEDTHRLYFGLCTGKTPIAAQPEAE
jgi:hypothetical protein